MQMEWTAATTGLPEFSTARITDSRFGSAMALGVPNSRMSAPLENALPAPVMTTAFTAGSAFALSSPCVMPTRVACDSPFMGGLAIVMTATSPCTLYSAVIPVPRWSLADEKVRSFFFDCRVQMLRPRERFVTAGTWSRPARSDFEPLLADVRIRAQRGRRALEHDAAMAHD